jgi:transcription antitermination factor NusG
VRRLLTFDTAGPMPMPMPDAAMASLLEKYRDGAPPPAPDFAAGDAVLIVSGPFADQYAKVEALDDKGRVRLLFDILGGTAQLSIRAECLASVEKRG